MSEIRPAARIRSPKAVIAAGPTANPGLRRPNPFTTRMIRTPNRAAIAIVTRVACRLWSTVGSIYAGTIEGVQSSDGSKITVAEI